MTIYKAVQDVLELKRDDEAAFKSDITSILYKLYDRAYANGEQDGYDSNEDSGYDQGWDDGYKQAGIDDKNYDKIGN